LQASAPPVPEAVSWRLADQVQATERRAIERALQQADGSQRQAAKLLGVARSTLIRKLRALGLTESGLISRPPGLE
jgi:DNA-binding NtrC family response regulator